MSMQRFGIFGKVFLYTLIFLLLTIGVTVIVFAQQFKDFYDYLQIQQYTTVFEPLKISIENDDGIDEIIQTANDFHDKNQSFPFRIETEDGSIVYSTTAMKQSATEDGSIITGQNTSEAAMSDTATIKIADQSSGTTTIKIEDNNPEFKGFTITKIDSDSNIDAIADYIDRGVEITLEDNLLLRTVSETDNADLYKDFIKKVLFISFLLLCASILGAVLFARGITNPIRRLADDTRKMACLEPVCLPITRRDEVGQLAQDVHNMYEKLKKTISNLEAEILREKEMEENQRYFFSAASHELKTPIAAVSALLEGMIAGIGDYKNHPKYLRECLNRMNAQNRIITEILEIVNLSDERIIPHKENVNLLSIINFLLPEYQTLAEKKEQKIIINVPETVFCYTDKKMLGNVLSNVMMNAIQNSPMGEEIRIWSEEKRDDSKIRFSILNTNAHIEEEVKTKLFEPFFRVDKARSQNEERGGLGLTIVKKVLDSMDISFGLETIDHDVMFWMELPI